METIKFLAVKKLFYAILILLLLIVAPLGGARWAGFSAASFLDFPPRTTTLTLEHSGFSWSVFIGILLFVAIVVIPFFIKVYTSRKQETPSAVSGHGFPGWGWAGLGIMLGGWFLAWTRLPWMAQLQPFTFTPPWIGYIILVNALTILRSGRSMITHQPGYLLALFVVSALFWWCFEYLNQFTQNWYYVNTGDLSRWQFFWQATLPFSTVLPAVIGTRDLLKTFPGFSAGLNDFIRIPVPYHLYFAAIGIILASIALAGLSLMPNYLYPMLWLAPLVIIVLALVLARKPNLFTGIAKGRWKEIYLLGMAALVCGFFWELWNYYSYTRWEYAIPFVERFHLFEMPALGYAGYLPFGLQCGVIAALVKEWFE